MISKRMRLALVLAALGSVAAIASTDINVTPVVSQGHVVTSFTAPNAYSDDAREVVQSGLLMTFTYTIELRRPSSIWLDRTIAETTAAASVKFDSLTGVYQVSKMREGRVVWSERTDKEADVRAWVTSFDQIALEPSETLESNADYYVRVHLRMTPHRTFYLWPWGRDDGSGRKDFTFIR